MREGRKVIYIFCFLIFIFSTAFSWESALFPEDANGYYFAEVDGFRLPDFTNVGYHAGKNTIPTVSSVKSISPVSGDNTSHINNALSDAKGGALLLNEGTYSVTGSIIIPPDTVLRGRGPDKTRIYVNLTQTENLKVIVGNRNSGTDSFGYSLSSSGSIEVTQDISKGATEIYLETTSGLQVGDWVIIKNEVTDALRKEYHNGITHYDGVLVWPRPYGDIKFLRIIEAINTTSKKITVDQPVLHPLKTRDNTFVKKITTMGDEIGVEDLSIGYKKPSSSGDVHNSRAIVFNNAYNSWIRNVRSYDPDTGDGNTLHLHSIGIRIFGSRWITVSDCEMSYPYHRGGGGNGYTFLIEYSYDILVKNCTARHGRHNFVFGGGGTSGNVITGFKSYYISEPDDFHSFLTVANLIDNYSGYCDGPCSDNDDRRQLSCRNRQHISNGAGYTGTDNVFWNVRIPSGKVVNSAQSHANGGKGYVIGATYMEGSKITQNNEWREGINMENTLRPVSLYHAQIDAGLEIPLQPPSTLRIVY